MMREAAQATVNTETRPQPGNPFPSCGPVLQVLPLLPPAARECLMPHLDPGSCVSGGPEWAAGRANIGWIVGTVRAPDLRALVRDHGLPVHTAYEGQRFSSGVRMLGFASQLLVWLRDNRPRRLLELCITDDIPLIR